MNMRIKVSTGLQWKKAALVTGLVALVIGGGIFIYGNFGHTEDAHAAEKPPGTPAPAEPEAPAGREAKHLAIDNLEDIQAYLTAVRQQREQYDTQVKLDPNPGESYAILRFSNPYARPFQLDIFDINGMKVRTYIDILSDFITIQKEGVMGEGYTYLLKDGRGTYYAGKLRF